MRESSKPMGDSVTLILNAKYHPDEASRELAGSEAVEYCIKVGDHVSLANISLDGEMPQTVRAAARKGVLPAAETRAKALGNDDPYFDVIETEKLDSSLRKGAAVILFSRYHAAADEAGLMRLCCSKQCNYEVRQACGAKLQRIAEDGCRFSLFFELTANPEVVYETRKSAGLRLLELAVEHGNFPILLRLGQVDGVPTDVRIELDGKADIAAQKAVAQAAGCKDTYLLQCIKDNLQLCAPVRARASEALEALARPEPSPLDGLPDNAMARELMLRLARQGGIAMQSEPPPSLRPGPKDLKKSS